MSRGLGKMQKAIIEALDESRWWMGDVKTIRLGPYKMVQGRYRDHKPEEGLTYAVRVNGKIVYLCDGEYDLSATLAFLTEKQDFAKLSVPSLTTSCQAEDTYQGVISELSVLKDITGDKTEDAYQKAISRFSNRFWHTAKRLIRDGYLTRTQEKSNRIVTKTKKISVLEKGSTSHTEDA